MNYPNSSTRQNALRAELLRRSQIRAQKTDRWIPHTPTPKQQSFLSCTSTEAFYGGAAGGGKTDALLMAALAYVDVPGYRALLFRRSYADLNLPGALMDRAREWLGGSSARWNAHDHIWTFPSGASLTFGYLESENDKYRYQSSELQYIGFDELTQFAESQYLYLFSRLRRLAGSAVPLRMRSASNPGGLGHEWVRARFVDATDDAKRVFIPARLADNPHLDQDTYTQSLENLDPVTRAQLLEGDWQVHPQGVMFKRDWFAIVEGGPGQARRVRYWDKAATEGGGARTAGVLIAKTSKGLYYVEDVVCGQWSALRREEIMRATAERDGREVAIWLEQEPGSGRGLGAQPGGLLCPRRPGDRRQVRAGSTADGAVRGRERASAARPLEPALPRGALRLSFGLLRRPGRCLKRGLQQAGPRYPLDS